MAVPVRQPTILTPGLGGTSLVPRDKVKEFPEAAKYLRDLAKARGEYIGVEDETSLCIILADILDGSVGALHSWLPAWHWDEWGVGLS